MDVQREEFKRLGILGDWDKPYLTLDAEYEADILRLFAELVEKGMLRDGDLYRYLVGAYPNGLAQRGNAPTATFGIEEVSPALPLKQSRKRFRISRHLPVLENNGNSVVIHCSFRRTAIK